MKKLSLLLWFMIVAVSMFSQTATNADGTLKFRGNVAILVEANSFTLRNGENVKQVDNETAQLLKTTARALSMNKFQGVGFGVVNRDDDAFAQVSQLIRENKLEDYMDGISVTAKNQGADYLFLVDITIYGEDDKAAQMEVDIRLMDIAHNLGYHTYCRSDAFSMKDESAMRSGISKFTKTFSDTMDDFLSNRFPGQYYIAKAKGKTWSLGAYFPDGMTLNDKFYAFRFLKEEIQLNNKTWPVQILQRVAVAQKPKLSGDGYIQVTSDKAVSNTSEIILFRNVDQPMNPLSVTSVTFFGLNYTESEGFDGLVKKRINNAVFSAITRHPGTQLIEHDLLPELKKERELQKSEDFLDGHVVEQMKAIGAYYLIKLEDFARKGSLVSFKMSSISVAENRIIRTVDVSSSIDNIENEMYKQICERFADRCIVKQIDKKTLEMTSLLTLREGEDCILEANKEIQNPMTGETSYIKVPLCKTTVETYAANRCTLAIKEVLSEEEIQNLEEYSAKGQLIFTMDGSSIKSNLSTKSDVKKSAEKQEKAEKRKDLWNKVKEAGLKELKENNGRMINGVGQRK